MESGTTQEGATEQVAGEKAAGEPAAVKPRSIEALKNVALSAMSVEEIAIVDASAGEPEQEKRAIADKIVAHEQELKNIIKTVNERIVAFRDELTGRMSEWQQRLTVKHQCALEIARRAKAEVDGKAASVKASKDAATAKAIQDDAELTAQRIRAGQR